jgi:two-component sensor histidine kinase
MTLTPNQAQSLTLAIHELATNALKYGSLSRDAGVVDVEWAIHPDRTFSFSWRESGGPTVSPPTRYGFGSRLIQRVLAQDFRGTVRPQYLPQGFVCELSAPIPGVEEHGSNDGDLA